MCLAIPMRVEAVDGLIAHCQAKGVWREVSLLMLPDEPPAVGDYVMVQMGRAIRRVEAEEARLAWELYDRILDESGGPSPP